MARIKKAAGEIRPLFFSSEAWIQTILFKYRMNLILGLNLIFVADG